MAVEDARIFGRVIGERLERAVAFLLMVSIMLQEASVRDPFFGTTAVMMRRGDQGNEDRQSNPTTATYELIHTLKTDA